MSYSLVVVDMQPQFQTSQKPETLTHVKSLLEKAIQDKAAIIFLEFEGWGPTNSMLKATVEGYNNVHFQSKDQNDGSNEVVKLIEDNDLSHELIRVCGVNTNYCVRETVVGLLDKFNDCPVKTNIKKIEVSKNGTNCSWRHEDGLNRMSELDRCYLID